MDPVQGEQEAELFGVADGIRVAATREIVANLVDRPSHVGSQGQEGRGSK